MCGIAGFAGAGDEHALRRMAGSLAHRGPDDDGFYVDRDRGVYLAHRRLSIVDLGGGHQPMFTADDRYAIVFNGEIYNFRELRAELECEGIRFRTDHSDTEVLLLAWRQWREAAFDRLNGMWAFAILDRERQELILSRDRFGKKPLYYYASAQCFAFSSELISLRHHPRVPSTLSQRALKKYYAYGFVPAPLSFIEGVNKLPGGHWLRVDLRTLEHRVDRYWQYRAEPFDERPRNAERLWTEQLASLLEEAVDRRLVADVPVGSFLSGGIDSSVVAALAARKVGKQLRTFSIGFEEASFDESAYAREVAAHIGTEHHVEMLSAQRALDIVPDILAGLDEPIADSSILPTFLLCQHARRHVTVALGGDGADELFAGYDPFKALRYARWYERFVPSPVHRAVAVAAARLPVSHRYMSFDFRLKRMLRGLDHQPNLRLPVWMSPLAPSELESLFREPLDLEDLYSEAIETWDDCASSDVVDRATAFYIRLYLQDGILVKVDRASMLNSLEVRAPFLDRDVVDFARRLPASVKLRGGTTKWILRQVAAPLVPERVIKRPKQGFAVPCGQWFSDGRLPDPPGNRGFNRPFWASALAAHRANQIDQRLYLWSDWILSQSHLYTAAAPSALPA